MKHISAFSVTAVALGFVLSTPALAAAPQAAAGAVEAVAGNDRFMNIRTDALLISGGDLNAEVDFRISDRLTLGPAIGSRSAQILFTDLSGFVGAARANYYLGHNAFTDGFMVSPLLGVASITSRVGNAEASDTGMYAAAYISHQWVWDSGLNINVGAGAAYYGTNDTLTAASGLDLDVPVYSGLVPSLELTVGWAI